MVFQLKTHVNYYLTNSLLLEDRHIDLKIPKNVANIINFFFTYLAGHWPGRGGAIRKLNNIVKLQSKSKDSGVDFTFPR